MINPTRAERIGHELYIWVRGRLVMKKWFQHGRWHQTALFHVAPSGCRRWQSGAP